MYKIWDNVFKCQKWLLKLNYKENNMVKKKITGIMTLIIGIMLVGAFTACGGDDSCEACGNDSCDHVPCVHAGEKEWIIRNSKNQHEYICFSCGAILDTVRPSDFYGTWHSSSNNRTITVSNTSVQWSAPDEINVTDRTGEFTITKWETVINTAEDTKDWYKAYLLTGTGTGYFSDKGQLFPGPGQLHGIFIHNDKNSVRYTFGGMPPIGASILVKQQGGN